MSLRLETLADARRPAVGRAEFEGVIMELSDRWRGSGGWQTDRQTNSFIDNTGAGAPARPCGGERRLARRLATRKPAANLTRDRHGQTGLGQRLQRQRKGDLADSDRVRRRRPGTAAATSLSGKSDVATRKPAANLNIRSASW